MKSRKLPALTLIFLCGVMHSEQKAPLLVPRGYSAPQMPAQKATLRAPTTSGINTRVVNGVAQPAMPVRRIASTSGANPYIKTRASRPTPYQRSQNLYRFGLMAGMASLSSGYEFNQTDRTDFKTGQNFVGGINADLQFSKVLGLELEGFYSMGPTQTVQFVGFSDSKVKLNYYGLMANPTLRYRMDLGSMPFTPKIGAGYGMLTMAFKADSAEPSLATEGSSATKGFYGVAGFDLEFLRDVILSIDYARSLKATSQYKDTGLNIDESAEEASFDRLRAGLLYRLTGSLYVGGSFIRRSMSDELEHQGNLGGPSSKESISQFLGNFAFEF